MTPRSRRTGFTLVEMLVVIAIIGILAAMLIPAIYAAVTNAREAAILNDITQIEMAIESYKNAIGDYPPNFHEDYINTGWGNTVLFRHLKRVTRHMFEPLPAATLNGNPLLGSPDPTAQNPTQIDAAEALVFWLAGLSKSAANPTTGTGGPLMADPNDQPNGVLPRLMIDRVNSYFEFKETQFIDLDQDGLPEYAPPQGPRIPYVYFDGRSYDNTPDTNNNGFADDANSDDRWAFYPRAQALIDQYGVARPYVTGSRRVTVNNNQILLPVYANEKKYQIIAAGLDGLYGSPTGGEFANERTRKVFMTERTQSQQQFADAIQYRKEDLDNIANFSGGVFEDQMP